MRVYSLQASIVISLTMLLIYINIAINFSKNRGGAKLMIQTSMTVQEEVTRNSPKTRLYNFSTPSKVVTLIPPSLDCVNCIVENKTIFFLETNPKVTHLNGRKLCAIETAARLNPENTVVVVIPKNNSLTHENIAKLSGMNFSNLFMMSIDFSGLISYYPSMDRYWKALDLGRPTKMQQYVQASDLIRYALLFDHGGFYLDSDTVSIKEMPKHFKNYLVEDFSVLKRYNAHTWSSVNCGTGSKYSYSDFKLGLTKSFIVHYFGGSFDGGLVKLTKKDNLYKLMSEQCPKAMTVLEKEVPVDLNSIKGIEPKKN